MNKNISESMGWLKDNGRTYFLFEKSFTLSLDTLGMENGRTESYFLSYPVFPHFENKRIEVKSVSNL